MCAEKIFLRKRIKRWNEMNEVKRFSAGSMRGLESAINCFALEHEIINVSLAYNQNNKYGEYNALVLYK